MSALVLEADSYFRDHVSGCPVRTGRRRACGRRPLRWLPSILLALTAFVSSATLANARVIGEKDLEKISQIKTIFTSLTNDIAQALKLTASDAESECLKSIQQEVVQTSNELLSYQYLLTIVSEMDDFGDDASLRSLVRFALDKSISMIDNERKRLSQPSDQCVRLPLSVAATQQALQFMGLTSEALKSIRPRF